MTRLPPLPELDWRDARTPIARAYDDVYFSAADGLEETRHVFHKGNNLAARWDGLVAPFTIGELGFGTGLNFLATWQAWRDAPTAPGAHLHYLALEASLPPRDALNAIASGWPDLADLTEHLLNNWPERAFGAFRLPLAADVTLILFQGDAADTLREIRGPVDAWFLDGFAPARNPSMWSEEVFQGIARLSRPGTTIGTYTVAGAVRRGLSDVGFAVEKAPGFGRKRECLTASFTAPEARSSGTRLTPTLPQKTHTPTITIHGAGIAGASLARTLAETGYEVSVFDPTGPSASGASGNPLGLLMPRLDAEDTLVARFMVEAFLRARAFYLRYAPAHCDRLIVEQRAKDDKDARRFVRVLENPPLPPDVLLPQSTPDALHTSGLILAPAKLVPALLDHPLISLSDKPVKADLTIHASGMRAAKTGLETALPLIPKKGQVDFLDAEATVTPAAIASGNYALRRGKLLLYGATFEAGDDAEVTRDASEENLKTLRALSPEWSAMAEDSGASARASVRATTPDRLPIIGPVPDVARVLTHHAPLRTGQTVPLPDAGTPLVEPGQFVFTGLGSRGFTFAPWGADYLAASLTGAPLPTTTAMTDLVSPFRFLIRGLTRNRL